jgi:hypothetical protein
MQAGFSGSSLEGTRPILTHAHEKMHQMTTWRGHEKPIENSRRA